MKLFAKILAAALVAFALPAFAGETVTLRATIIANGPVTLGDIFEGAGASENVVVGPAIGGAGNLVLDASQLQRIAAEHGLTWANETGRRQVIARREGGPALPAAAAGSAVAAATATGAPARGVEALTWARNINAGEVVHAEDLTFAVVPASPADAAQDSEILIGKAARRPLRAGAVAMGRDVTAPQVIRKDDMVTITFVSGGVSLELQAKAKEPAALGESFDVTNLASGKVIQAIAAGPGRAVVGPEADRLRTLAITDPTRLALR